MATARPPTASGFTLIEVLVALPVLAVFAPSAWPPPPPLAGGEARPAPEPLRWQTPDAMYPRRNHCPSQACSSNARRIAPA